MSSLKRNGLRTWQGDKMILDIECSDEKLLQYTGRDIQQMILDKDETWKQFVPEVAHKAALHVRSI